MDNVVIRVLIKRRCMAKCSNLWFLVAILAATDMSMPSGRNNQSIKYYTSSVNCGSVLLCDFTDSLEVPLWIGDVKSNLFFSSTCTL